MVSKESRTKIREKSTEDSVTVSVVQLKDHVWLCSEVIIICMLRLLTIQLETLLYLPAHCRKM